MAKRPIIRYGDRTTHGGTVVSADPTYDIYGKNVARVGDKVVCPRCKGTFPIVTGAPDVWSGQNIARQDDMTSCGAKLIASQSTATIDHRRWFRSRRVSRRSSRSALTSCWINTW